MKLEVIGLITFVLLCVVSCEYRGPEALYNPDAQGKSNPKITYIIPSSESNLGAFEIRIVGENFSEVASENNVYFSGVKAHIKNATATEILTSRPSITGDSLRIRVSVAGAFEIAEFFPYRLDEIKSDKVFEIERIRVFDIDDNDDFYFLNVNKVIFSYTPEGEKIEVAKTKARLISDMKVGPGGYFYLQKEDDQQLYRLAPGSSSEENFATLPAPVKFFDFDHNLNIYSAGLNSGIIVTKPDGSSRSTGMLENFNILAIRVYNDCVYTIAVAPAVQASVPTRAVWKSAILSAEGDLAAAELVFDFSDAGEYLDSDIKSLEISADGYLYVGTTHADPLLMIRPDGRSEPLFPGALQPIAEKLVWGNDIYLYMYNNLSNTRKIIQVAIGKQGAPHFGRN